MIVARLWSWQAADRVGGAAAQVVLGRGLVRGLRVRQLAVRGHHGHVVRQEGRADRHRRVEQATRVVAQVEDHALDVRVGLVDLFDLADEVVDRAILELAHPHPGVAGLDDLAAHALDADFLARDRDRERAALGLAEDRQHDLGVGLATHPLDGLVHAQAPDRRLVDSGDEVAGLDARAERRGAFDRGLDLDDTVFHADFDAHADELAGRALAEFTEALLVEIL
jgi:hypothetical protein